MKKIELDVIDKGLLNVLQAGFPIAREPFALTANEIAINEVDVIGRVRRLKRGSIIRYIGPVFDARSLGYSSTLVAMSVPVDRLESAARIVNEHPGVSHNYQRDHQYNLWFTLTLPADKDIQGKVLALSEEIEPEAMMELPALKRFKVSALFDVGGSESSLGNMLSEPNLDAALDSTDWAVIIELQRDLPIVRRPFDGAARAAGVSVDDFLERGRSLKERGVMRRFGAAVAHTKVGFAANVMVCWNVPRDSVGEAGRRMAAFSEVSHCYERATRDGWPYNLYTMIHGRTERECRDVISKIASRTGIEKYETLFTVKEFKKERIRFAPPGSGSTANRYYPISVDIGGKRCVVIGGGDVALRKVRTLLEHSALVQVIGPELCPGIEALIVDGKITATRRSYRRDDLRGAFVVIAATDDAVTNERVARDAHRLGKLVNVVDVPDRSNFIVPSCLRRGDLSIAVSTGGASPALARRIRERLEGDFGEEYETLLSLVGRVRAELKQGGIIVSGDGWHDALDLDVLLDLVRKDRLEQAERHLIDKLTGCGRNGRC
ncbi:MAG: NAD(P)-dependent oxidoreductase [Chloroflexota bacterium]|nr:NAD(P)-dependent oxidoreductase [Chloroflexota bacterium]